MRARDSRLGSRAGADGIAKTAFGRASGAIGDACEMGGDVK